MPTFTGQIGTGLSLPGRIILGLAPPRAYAVYYQALLAVQSAIRSIGLTGIGAVSPLPAAQVYLRKLPADRTLTLPCVIVSLVPVPEGVETRVMPADDLGYPVYVAIVVANNQDLTVQEPELRWREQIRQKFHQKRPAEVISGLTVPLKICLWEPAPVLDLDLFKSENLFVSAAIIRVITREVRP